MRTLLLMVALALFVFLVPGWLRATLVQLSPPAVTDFATLLQPGRHRINLDVDGHQRTFVFITPASFQPGQTLPLVFFFHGAGGTSQQAAKTYGWTEKAQSEHFFVAFPQGLPVRPDAAPGFLLNPPIWRDERPAIRAGGIDDVHFFEVLLGKLQSVLPIDAKRIYVTGFSNGAGMTFTLGGHFPGQIAAIAPVSSQSFVRPHALARPLPVYYLAGTADPLVPYLGGTVTLPWENVRTMPPVQESVDLWTSLDGLPTSPKVESNADGVRVLRYGPDAINTEILFTTVEGNGHHWPGTAEPLPHTICGPALDPFNATDRIWDFFKSHPLP